jgi:hypothetical protein
MRWAETGRVAGLFILQHALPIYLGNKTDAHNAYSKSPSVPKIECNIF